MTANAPPIPATLAISQFTAPASTSIRPQRVESSWADLVTLLTTHQVRVDKDGPGWSPAIFKPGTSRAKENVDALSCFVADLEHLEFEDYGRIVARLNQRGLAFIVYSTFRCTPEDIRCRIVLPLSRPVTAADWSGFWHRANHHIFGGQVDPQTKDASRFFYLPACPPDTVKIADSHAGEALDPDSLPPAPTFTSNGHAVSGGANRGVISEIGWRAMAFLAKGADVGKQRGEALAAIRNCLAAGWPHERIVEQVWLALRNSPIGDSARPWTEADVEQLVTDLEKRDAPPPEPMVTIPVLAAGRPLGSASGTIAATPTGAAAPTPPATFHLTDLGNAERLVANHGEELRFCKVWGKWLHWTGQCWEIDDTGEVIRRAKRTVRGIYAEAADVADDETRKAIVSHARRSEAASKIAAMVSLAESEKGIPILPADLDADPWLLTVQNGTIDLRTGTLRPHQREDYITKMAPVRYDREATCPGFLKLLERILPDPAVRQFLQKGAGYSATGDTSERVLFFLHGTGANGKSTVFATLAMLLGDFASRTPTDTLLIKREGGIPNDLARLKGARFVYASEAEEGKRLAESLIKDLTGGDKITARFLRGEFFEFDPEFKVWLATNHKPIIRGTDNAIWARIRLIPFDVTIPEPERIPRRQILATIRTELPGILNWVLEGCRTWLDEGLGMPEAVKQATDGYRAEMDVLADFLAECCVTDANANVTPAALFAGYRAWCEANNEKTMSQKALGLRLKERGFDSARPSGKRIWLGLGLQSPRPDGGDPMTHSSPMTHHDANSDIAETFISHEGLSRKSRHDASCNQTRHGVTAPVIGDLVNCLDPTGVIQNPEPMRIIDVRNGSDGQPWAFFAETATGWLLDRCEVIGTVDEAVY